MDQELFSRKQRLVSYFLSQNILITLDSLESLDRKDIDELVLSLRGITNRQALEMQLAAFITEKKKKITSALSSFPKRNLEGVHVLFNYSDVPKKREIQDFVQFYNARYKAIERLLRGRQELAGVVSIGRLSGKKDREPVALIGMVTEKSYTKNGNILLTLEDPTGTCKVLAYKDSSGSHALARDIVHDEVIGVVGLYNQRFVLVQKILHPDVPLTKELRKSPEEGYALFISDLHIGSNEFLEDNFIKMLHWLRGEVGSDSQKEIAQKTKYIFMGGDIVEGIGIYQGQEDTLKIRDIYKQYEYAAELLNMIPEHIPIILCPGNHDALRIAEPQPQLCKDFSKPLWDIKNMTLVTNPSIVNIDASESFPGLDILMYHGYSFDYYAANVDSIRMNGGYDRADLIMKFLLERRHLAPTHASTLYIPDAKKDPLVIERIPDFFLTGHIHRASVSQYKNITLVNGSCWQGMTAFQEKVGHNPEPCRIFAMNLQTRQVKILKF